jgi:hypothetical protein
MRRSSRRTKHTDTRQFDLFGGASGDALDSGAGKGAIPAASNDAFPLPSTPPSHEAQVLAAIVKMLTRHWSQCAAGSDLAQ